MRKITFLKSLMVMTVLVLSSSGLFAQNKIGVPTVTYTKITTLEALTDGDYVIVNSGDAYAMNNTIAGSYFANTAVTPSTGSITNPDASIVWEIKSHVDGGYTIYNASSAKYVSYTGSSNASYAVAAVAGSAQRWNITYASNLFVFANAATSTRILQYNSGSPRFACYTGSQQNLMLYKKVIAGATAIPSFSVSGGSYTSPQTITLSSTTSGAKIYYTTNGDEPTSASTLYTTGIVLNTTAITTIKAIAYDANDANPSAVVSATYNVNVDPLITVNKTTIPAMSSYVNTNVMESFDVSGTNLTAEITVTLGGTNASLFEMDMSSVPQTDGIAVSTELTVKYKPVAPGTHTATLTLSSPGAQNVVFSLTGTSVWTPLAAPVATAATAVTPTSFTANWETVSGATSYDVNVYTKSNINASDLMITEYIEGSSYNKVIELYNGTASTIDLSNYSLNKQTNGAGEYGNELVLSGMLPSGSTYVISYVSGSSSASAEILAKTDLETNSSVVNFNGDDAVGLFKNGAQIDEVGVFNQTSKWGENLTLVRKSSVANPKAVYDAAEWNTYAIDYIDMLGMHSIMQNDGILGSPFNVSVLENAVSGLSTETDYYYTVMAKNTNVTSMASNEIKVTTGSTTALNGGSKLNKLSVSNGNILLTASANQTVEIFNSVGQKIKSHTTTEGLNAIPVAATGVVFVKFGTEISKLIMQ